MSSSGANLVEERGEEKLATALILPMSLNLKALTFQCFNGLCDKSTFHGVVLAFSCNIMRNSDEIHSGLQHI